MIILPTYPECDWPIGSSGGASKLEIGQRPKKSSAVVLEKHADRPSSFNS